MVPSRDHLLVDELDAADVEPARRLVEHEKPHLLPELARDDHLLLVAAGERRRQGLRPGRADVELLDEADRVRRDLAEVAHEAREPARERRIRIPREGQVVVDGVGEDETEALTIRRDERHPTIPALVHRRSGEVFAGEPDRSGGRRRRPMSDSTISSCPLPATPAIPTISPARTTRSRPRSASCPRSSFARRPATSRAISPGCDRPRSTRRFTARPTMSSASSFSFVSLGLRLPTTLPRRITVIRSAISSTSSSLWLMKITLAPSDRSRRKTSKISRVSCGVSTAVGSSSTRIRAFR